MLGSANFTKSFTRLPAHLLLSHQKRTFADTAAPSRRGAGLGQRLSSFLVGAGLTGVATQYYLYQEIKSGNTLLIAKQREIERRLLELEKKN